MVTFAASFLISYFKIAAWRVKIKNGSDLLNF